MIEPEAVDYFGFPIKIGDRVIFPAGAEQMEGTVTKLGKVCTNGFYKGKIRNISVKNDSGYTKNKVPDICVNVSLIKDALPEYRL